MPSASVVLLVEDNEDDILLFQRTFNHLGLSKNLRVVRNGIEAMNYLEGIGRFRDTAAFPCPALVLLDLTLPGVSGFEVLKWIRQHPRFANLTVVVVTASESTRDADMAYKLGADSFVVKPFDVESIATVLERFPRKSQNSSQESEEKNLPRAWPA